MSAHRRGFVARAPGALRSLLGSSLIVLGLVVFGCAEAPEPAAPESMDRIRAVVLPYLSHVPMYIAKEEGYFADQGLDVEFVRLGRQLDVMAALARGEVDAASGMLTVNELNLIAAGSRIRMIAALGKLDPDPCSFTSFVVRRQLLEDGTMVDPERFRRLRVDANITLPFGYFYDLALAPLGLTLQELDWTDLPAPAAVDAVARGTIDLTLTSEPFLQMHLEDPDQATWKHVGDMLPEYVITMLMFGPRLLDERVDIGERFTLAVLQAIRQYNLGKTRRNLEIVADATGLSPERARSACWAPMTDDARLVPEVFLGYQQWNVAAGLAERVLEEDELFDHRFVEYAKREVSR